MSTERPSPAERAIGAVLVLTGHTFEIVRRVRARRFTERKNR